MKPPALARGLVRLFSDARDRAFLLQDLDDRFSEMARAKGSRAARRWYWAQALSAVPWALRADGELMRRRSWAGLAGDLRLALRMLTRRPLYAVGVAGTLGLGLSAATLSFAVAWRVWLAPMPYPDPERVVRLYEIEPPAGGSGASDAVTESRRQRLSATLLEDLRANSWRTIEAVSAASRGMQPEWTRDGEAQRISGVAVSPDGFGILGIVPTLGRLPAVSEREILLSDGFWRSTFGADSAIVGSAMDLGYGPLPIVGVARLPAGFPGEANIATTIDFGDTEDRAFRYVEAIARVGPGHAVAAAEAELNAFLGALAEVHPEHRGWSLEAVVLGDDLVRPFRPVLALLLAAGTTFLLLAGVNVTGLVAARRVDGRQDRSIRLALGASEGRLLRGSLIESLMLATVGSAAGVLSAYWLIAPLRAIVPQDVPRLDDVGVTWPLALGALSVGLSVGIALGVTGYLVSRGARPSVGRAPTWRAVGVGGRRALVVGQVALTTLLTAGGAAILHRLSTLRAIDLGFDPEGVSTTSAMVPDRWNVTRELLDRLRTRGIPAAAAFNTPMSGDSDAYDIPQLGMRADAASDEVVYHLHLVSPGYFSLMGIDLLAGRDFGPDDHASSQRVVAVSDQFADRYFPAGTPVESVIGRILSPLIYEETGPMVVGVVRSTRHFGPDAPVEPEIYSPLSQLSLEPITLLVRGQPDQVAEAVSEVQARVDPDLRWAPLVPYTSYLDEWFAPLRLQVAMIGVLGALGLLLASLGLYSLMAYQVAAARRELGVRKALGAPDRTLLLGVVARGVAMTIVGAALGLAIWYRLLPWTAELVDGIDAGSHVVPISAGLVVGGSCVLATLLPAIRATQVDPVVTLKAE